MDIRITVDDNRLVARVDGLHDAVRQRVVVAMTRIEARLEAGVRAAAPSKTGALRSQVGGRVYQDNPNRVAAYVGVYSRDAGASRKAAALEYGSRGLSVPIQAHEAKLAHIFGRAIAPIQVTRQAHTRIPAVKPHNFLRGTFTAQRSAILAELQAALDRAIRETG